MKTFLILSCLIALVCGAEKQCRCGAFVTLTDSEQEVLAFPTIDLDDCTEILRCTEFCKYEWEGLTQDGNLCASLPNGHTVGQQMCDTLSAKGIDYIEPHLVFLYVSVCNGPWSFDGQTSKQDLQCKAGKLILDC